MPTRHRQRTRSRRSAAAPSWRRAWNRNPTRAAGHTVCEVAERRQLSCRERCTLLPASRRRGAAASAPAATKESPPRAARARPVRACRSSAKGMSHRTPPPLVPEAHRTRASIRSRRLRFFSSPSRSSSRLNACTVVSVPVSSTMRADSPRCLSWVSHR